MAWLGRGFACWAESRSEWLNFLLRERQLCLRSLAARVHCSPVRGCCQPPPWWLSALVCRLPSRSPERRKCDAKAADPLHGHGMRQRYSHGFRHKSVPDLERRAISWRQRPAAWYLAMGIVRRGNRQLHFSLYCEKNTIKGTSHGHHLQVTARLVRGVRYRCSARSCPAGRAAAAEAEHSFHHGGRYRLDAARHLPSRA